MIAHRELTDPTSCINRAYDDEMTFVLLGRDASAPFAIRLWAANRIALGLNAPLDPQIIEALDCADAMESQRPVLVGRKKSEGSTDSTEAKTK